MSCLKLSLREGGNVAEGHRRKNRRVTTLTQDGNLRLSARIQPAVTVPELRNGLSAARGMTVSIRTARSRLYEVGLGSCRPHVC